MRMKNDYRKQILDPLQLFGALPPRALKNAQSSAYESLKEFVYAANIGQRIMELLLKILDQSLKS